MGKIHRVGGVLEACVAAGVPFAGVYRVSRLHGGRAGHLRGAVAADYQADGREPGLHVQGHGCGVWATACALCVWRGHHHDEHGRGGNHHLRHYSQISAKSNISLAQSTACDKVTPLANGFLATNLLQKSFCDESVRESQLIGNIYVTNFLKN